MRNSNLKLASDLEVKALLQATKSNKRYRCIILLMLDAGLRVSEVIELKVRNFDFGARIVKVKSLKKRSDNPVYREIPLSYRLYGALSDYLTSKSLKPDNWIFPSDRSRSGHLERITIYKYVKRHTMKAVSPHMLRHTFGTNVVRSSDLKAAQRLLGHARQETTEIYTHVKQQELRSSIESFDNPSVFEKIRRRYKKPKLIAVGTHVGNISKIVGRREEIQILENAIEKKINLYIDGEQGVGKSYLLDNIKNEKILWLDDFRQVKMTVGNILKHLSEKHGKAPQLELMYGELDASNIISKSNVHRLVDLILAVCEKNEFTIVIDDLTNVTKSGVIILEKFKEKFHMIVAARKIKIDHSTFMTNFERMTVDLMTREESIKYVYLLSRNMRNRIEDYKAFANYVIKEGRGNPLHMKELVERFSKEQFISYADLSKVSHMNSKRTFDFTVPVLLTLSSLMVLRYVGGEVGVDSGAFRLFGGAFLVIALFARQFFVFSKRKFI